MHPTSPIRAVQCWGDSLTAGYGAAPSAGWVPRLSRRFPQLAFYNHGVCGRFFSDILADAWTVVHYPAEGELLFLMGGTNDILCGVRYEALCRAAEKEIRALAARIPVVLGVPLLTTRASIAAGWQQEWQYEGTNGTLRRYGDFLRALAAELALPVLDFQAAFPQDDALYADGVHPNGEGYARMAGTAAPFFAALAEPAAPPRPDAEKA